MDTTTQPTNPDRPVKTVRIVDLLAHANHVLANSVPEYTAQREAIASFIEKVLHDANVYAGFRLSDGQSGDLDDTRRFYYTHQHLIPFVAPDYDK